MFLLCCTWIVGAASFRVNVPDKFLVAIRGRPAVLACEFTPDPDLSSLVLTWQRDSRVVHSFYYQQDQLDRQSPEYHNRTSLFISEIALYSEPRLGIHVNSSALTVQFETEGFPKPEVIWLDEHGQNLNYHLELHDQSKDGLYLVKSSYEAQKPAVNVTFTLKNHLLNQKLQRPMFLSYGKDPLSL
ncbi:uncharacterized protein LOC130086785 isoform X4 [Rhinichthys klamathensis goyatoka]|uniref:uncharacterized protein LOC130086785 isoform X4 n=1 Tax=Rhinichthys klamathensis goyatoka TaxID=3034132 RepID=UPI0024B5DCF9|nr:uncharacterized protein LOC130086785 isoform X4 [Rhinichthys klamathensis goyatoka]